MTSIYLIRHGDYASGPPDAAGVEADLGLTELGRRQAGALRDRLARTEKIKANALYSSTMVRALQTAALIAPALGQAVIREPALEEWRSGNDAIGKDKFSALWRALDSQERQTRRFMPGCETAAEFNDRVLEALNRIVSKHQGQQVLVVAHGGVIEVAFCHFLGLSGGPFRNAYPAVGNTSITHWRRDAESQDWVLESSNDMHHLVDV